MKYALYLLLAHIIATTFFELYPIDNASFWATFLNYYLDFFLIIIFDTQCKKDLRKFGNKLFACLKNSWEKWKEISVQIVLMILDNLIFVLSGMMNIFSSLRNLISKK